MPDRDMNPLVEPPVACPPPSGVERMLVFVPVLGWLVAAVLEYRRRKPVEDFVGQALSARTATTWAAWGDDPVRLDVAAVVNGALMDEFGWPNMYCLPGDRLALLTWGVGGTLGGELLAFVVSLELRLRVRLMDLDVDFERDNLGAYVDRAVERVKWRTPRLHPAALG
ncbi:MAG: hypothetical protein JWO31_1897 [Phycisphaerales bacterium]|nr:hypothetical protein [Phycisphaerales bacterium]